MQFQPICTVSRTLPVRPSMIMTLSPVVHATHVPFSLSCTGPPWPVAPRFLVKRSLPVCALKTQSCGM